MHDLTTLTDIQLQELEWKERHNWDKQRPFSDALAARWDEHRVKFPRVFTQGDIGTQVGAGWWPVILEAASQLEKLLDDHPGWMIATVQLKEKFGGMRWYIRVQPQGAVDWGDYGDDAKPHPPEGLYAAASEITNDACNKADRLCEICGEPGETRGGGWVKTLCDVHAKNLK